MNNTINIERIQLYNLKEEEAITLLKAIHIIYREEIKLKKKAKTK